MNCIDNSMVIKLLGGSWIFGWLLTAPVLKTHYYRYSAVHNIVARMITALMKGLGKIGLKIRGYNVTSIIINYFQIVLGLSMVLAAFLKLFSRSHTPEGYVISAIIALIGILLVLLEIMPESGQKSRTLGLINNWIRSD